MGRLDVVNGSVKEAGIPLHRSSITDREFRYVREALSQSHISGDGPFSRRVVAHLEQLHPASRGMLVHSCTAALEIAALLADLKPGDEVIMPSFTFVSTANAFVLRGARPVFVDVRADTFNLDETKLAEALSPRTKAIVPVHYAGVACEMDSILAFAKEHQLYVFEDAAQAYGSSYRGRALGTLGDLGAYSFHETKNFTSGEGGVLMINRPDWVDRSHILRDKGTNRSLFLQGMVDKYTWVDVGSSYVLSDILAALMLAQMERLEDITDHRRALWQSYQSSLEGLEKKGVLRRPIIPEECQSNYHIFPVLFDNHALRLRAQDMLRSQGIGAAFHYIPLHSSPAGVEFGRTQGELAVTTHVSSCLLRLPLFHDMSSTDIERVVSLLEKL